MDTGDCCSFRSDIQLVIVVPPPDKKKRGPVFAAAFSPLIQITVAVIGVSIVHEQLFLGSILGSVLVVVGLYFLLWGKSEDVRNTEVMPSLQKTEDIQELFPTQTA
ncbi:uncharacterized protein A4U43_C08F2450 [Asparagus officinalis]|nr:uncharacterized protein A4U43_C08F2450 [Asparagus officinalis]